MTPFLVSPLPGTPPRQIPDRTPPFSAPQFLNPQAIPHTLRRLIVICSQPLREDHMIQFLLKAPNIFELAFQTPIGTDAFVPSSELLTLSNGRQVRLHYQNTRSHLDFQHMSETLQETSSIDWYLRDDKRAWN